METEIKVLAKWRNWCIFSVNLRANLLKQKSNKNSIRQKKTAKREDKDMQYVEL